MKRGAVMVVLALAFSSVMFAATERVNRNDAELYYRLAVNVAAGNGLSSSLAPPHNWVGTREPLYPLALGAFFRLTRPGLPSVFVFQAILHAATALIAWRLALALFGSAGLAYAVGLATAGLPTLANFTVYTLRETLFTFLVLLATFLTVRVTTRANRGWIWVAAGMAWALATLCRGTALPVPLLLGAFFVGRAWLREPTRLRSVWKETGLMLAGTAAALAPWLLVTSSIAVDTALTPRVWPNVYVRASKVLLTRQELKMYAVYCVSESLADRLYPGNNLRSLGEGYFYRPFGEKVAALRASGLTNDEINALVKREALGLIAAHPVRYALTGVLEFVKFNSFSTLPVLNEEPTERRFGGRAPLLAARGVLKLAGFLLVLAAIPGAVLAWRHGGAVVVIVLAYYNVAHLGLDTIGRYAVPIIPLYLVCALGFTWARLGRRASSEIGGAPMLATVSTR